MLKFTTVTAGIIAALGIGLAGAGTAAASTDVGQPHITPSPSFAPQHIEPAVGFNGNYVDGFLGAPGTHRHHGHR